MKEKRIYVVRLAMAAVVSSLISLTVFTQAQPQQKSIAGSEVGLRTKGPKTY